MYDIRNMNIWKSDDTGRGPLSESPSINISIPGGGADIYTGSVLADMPIDELNLTVRSYNCLRRAGCSTVGDVLHLAESSENGLMKIRNLGAKSAREILAKIEDQQALLLQREENMPFRQNKKKLPANQLVYRELQNKFVKIRQVNILAILCQKALTRMQEINPPTHHFLLDCLCIKGKSDGGLDGFNPTSTQHQPTPRNYAAFKGIIL